MVRADDSDDADPSTYDRYRELKRFDDSKAGVNGLADSGITKLPRFFVRPPEDIAADRPPGGSSSGLEIPVIDLGSLAAGRPAAVARVLAAAREVGFFQVVNHGVPGSALAAARAFHELPGEVKAGYYSREAGRKVKFRSNFDPYESKHASWRDTLFCVMGPDPLDPLELPLVCRTLWSGACSCNLEKKRKKDGDFAGKSIRYGLNIVGDCSASECYTRSLLTGELPQVQNNSNSLEREENRKIFEKFIQEALQPPHQRPSKCVLCIPQVRVLPHALAEYGNEKANRGHSPPAASSDDEIFRAPGKPQSTSLLSCGFRIGFLALA
ncbi:hypothetical protein NL676_021192 [Syzygium grande]|nr:hypothetical protein NL676_021192 [Syzygium grande]